MPECIENPYRGIGIGSLPVRFDGDARSVKTLLGRCPRHEPTPLRFHPELASYCNVETIFIKDESSRMGLGSFKALGAAYAIAKDAVSSGRTPVGRALTGKVYATASAGNHGLSVAAGAAVFGARAVIYLSTAVPEAFAARLRERGAEVVRAGETYEDSMTAAEQEARHNGWTLLSDSSWDGYTDLPHRVMEGYLQIGNEIAARIPVPPTHVVLQAGVGGMAASISAHARHVWGDLPDIIVVEPAAAPALFESILAGRPVAVDGPVSSMGRLDCKVPSLIALASLARDADLFVTISEEEAHEGTSVLNSHGVVTSSSGGAGLSAVIAGLSCLGSDSRVLAIVSEGPEDA